MENPQLPHRNAKLPGYAGVTCESRSPRGGELPGQPSGSAALVLFAPLLFAKPLARQRLFGPALFTGLHVVTVLLDLLDDVFLLHAALETAQRVLQGFAFLNAYFGHSKITALSASNQNRNTFGRAALYPKCVLIEQWQ
jgi:hypothetical protein